MPFIAVGGGCVGVCVEVFCHMHAWMHLLVKDLSLMTQQVCLEVCEGLGYHVGFIAGCEVYDQSRTGQGVVRELWIQPALGDLTS